MVLDRHETARNMGDPLQPLIERATDWLLRLDDAPTDTALRVAAEAWRMADPAHGLAWDRAERAYRLMAQAPASRPAASTRQVAVPRRKSASRQWFAGAAVALAACLLLIYGPAMLTHLRADIATGTAELRQVTLSDGTVVELAAQSALDVRFSAERRSVTLFAGQAFFNVAPQAGRPFEVLAADLAVTVVGTAFDVHLRVDAATVGVQHGVVQVRSVRSDAPIAAQLGAGDQLTVERRGGAFRQTRVQPEEIASWRDQRLFVEGATVGAVVDELRRYNPGWIVVADGGLARQQVTGLYDLRDPDRALRMLIAPFGGHVREVTPFLKVVSGP
jgi:transmembrane sensor